MYDDMINVDLAELIHSILIRCNQEHKGDEVMLELTVASLRKVFDAEIENTLNVLRIINRLSEEEKTIIDKMSC